MSSKPHCIQLRDRSFFGGGTESMKQSSHHTVKPDTEFV